LGLLDIFFDSNKQYEEKIKVLEKRLYKAGSENSALEEKLESKDQDIKKSDKSIQKIIQTWKNINSYESLPVILSTILNGLSTDLDFLYCMLFQLCKTNEGNRLKVIMDSNVEYFDMDEILGHKLKSFGILYDYNDNLMVKAIKTQKTCQMEKFQDIFKGSDLMLEKNRLDRLESIFIDRAVNIIPLSLQGKPFGCLVAVSLKHEVSLMDKNYLKLFAGQIELSVSMTNLLDIAKAQAVTDVLTGLYNRRYFNETLNKEAKKSLRTRRPFTLITLDLDHLKQINDNFGHTAGDAAISAIGKVLLKSARESDIPARFGGEEFALIMPDTDIDGGLHAAERIRKMIETQTVEGHGNITASIGVATFIRHTETLEELIEIVDQAMYLAKNNGRNRVEVAKNVSIFDIAE